ncbi:MAG: U32 family peptidase [Clostridiales bacterium]|nr:U32 family peptidase [Clostridiales bacterium]
MQIVAPAGSKSGLRAAVNAGADAVYLGLPLFGARAKAENFPLETLKSEINFAHVFGTKVFITLNTLIKDDEMQTALDMAKRAYDCGADAAIVQDIRYIENLMRILPHFPLHASTQMGVHNADGAKVLLDMGIRRAVLSRETLPEDISEIKKTGIEIEFFVQGALCISFSGNCYFSSLASSYSGNRGKCMQLCRKQYIKDGKRGYFLSAKDICLYDKLDVLEKLGVDAIKIEGRMRSDEYVAQAVRVYKSNMPSDEARDALKAVYNRGDYCAAYIDGNGPFNVIYSKSQGNIGKSVGKISKVVGKRVVVNDFEAHQNDGFKILRNGEEIGGAHAVNGEISADCACKVGDELRRTHDGALSQKLLAFERKIDIDVSVDLAPEVPPVVTATAGAVSITHCGEHVPQIAKSCAIANEDVFRAFNKVSDTPFSPKLHINITGAPFLPVSALNELRRTAYAKLYSALAEANAPIRKKQAEYKLDYNKFDGHGAILLIDDAAVLTPDIVDKIDYIAIDPRDYGDFSVPDVGKPILLNAPITARGKDIDIIKSAIENVGIYGVISNNLYTLRLTDKPILLGTGHNIIGYTDFPHITSYEADKIEGFAYMYGYAPMMTLCHCPYGKCINCDGYDELIDESNRKFKLRRYKLTHCYWQLLNCVPHDLRNAAEKHKDRVYDCRGMSASDILCVLNGDRIDSSFTRGNINKGLK